MAQQILKVVDGSFKSFFGLLKKAKQGKHALKDCRLPRYLPKEAYVDIGITLPAMWLELLKALVLSNYLKCTRSLKSSMQDVEFYGQGGILYRL